MLVDDAIWLYGRGVDHGDIALADAARILVTVSALPPAIGEVLTEASAQAALRQWRSRPATDPRSGGDQEVAGARGTAVALQAGVPPMEAFLLVPFDDATAAALARPAGDSLRQAMESAAAASGGDAAWFCWNLGKRLYSIETSRPFLTMPRDYGPREPDVVRLSTWIGSLMTLLLQHARYLDPSRPFRPDWPAPDESPARETPPYFPRAATPL